MYLKKYIQISTGIVDQPVIDFRTADRSAIDRQCFRAILNIDVAYVINHQLELEIMEKILYF